MASCLVAVLATILAVASPPARASQPSVHVYTGTYVGSVSYQDVLPPSPTYYVNGATITQSMSWTVKIRDEYRDGHLVSGNVSQSAQGTVSDNCTAAVAGGGSCTNYGCKARATVTSPNVNSAAGLVGPGASADAVSGGFRVPLLSYYDVEPPGGGYCPNLNYTDGWDGSSCAILGLSSAEQNTWVDVLGNAVINAARHSGARNFDVDHSDTAACDGVTESQSLKVQATASVNGGVAPPHNPKKTNNDLERRREKLEAQKDLLQSIEIAQLPCGISAVGGAAAIWGTVVPGVGGAALVPATLIGAHDGAICAVLVARIYDDARIAHDPPRSDYETIAQVRAPRVSPAASSACRSYHGTNQALCDELDAKLANYQASMDEVNVIDGAILTTIDRQTGAMKAGDTAALTRQNAEGKKLESQFETALRRESRDGKSLAHMILASHITAKLTATQDAQAIAAAQGRLNQRPATNQAALIKLLGASDVTAVERPKAVNLLDLLR